MRKILILTSLFFIVILVSCEDDPPIYNSPIVYASISGYIDLKFWADDANLVITQPSENHILTTLSSNLAVDSTRYDLDIYFEPNEVVAGVYDLTNSEAKARFFIRKGTDSILFDKIIQGELRLNSVTNTSWSGNFWFKISTSDDSKILTFTSGSINYSK